MQIHEFAGRLAAELGPPWRPVHEPDSLTAHIEGHDHETLELADGDHSHRRAEHGRVRITGLLGDGGALLDTEQKPRPVTVRADRHPALIAGHIERELLEPYRQALSLARSRAAAETARLARRDALLDALVAILAPAERVQETRVYLHGDRPVRGHLIVPHSGSLIVELHVDADHAVAFAETLATVLDYTDTTPHRPD